MAPVIGYARTDRIDRSQKFEREESPNSNASSDSGPGISSRQRGTGRLRSGSEANSDLGIYPSPPSFDRPTSSIEDCCLGTPKKVSQSHSGAVELYISLQEKAVFLPTVKNRHRHRRQHNETSDHSRSSHSHSHNHGHSHNNNHNRNQTEGSRRRSSVGHGNHVDHHRASNQSSVSASNRNSNHQRNSTTQRTRQRGSSNASHNASNNASNNASHNVSSNPSQRTSNLEATVPNTTNSPTPQPSLSSLLHNASSPPHGAPQLGPQNLAYPDINNENENEQDDDDRSDRSGNEHGDAPPSFEELNEEPPSDDDSKHGEPCSTLRGSVLLKLSKPTKIKEIGINFYCISRTLWNLLPQPALFVDSALPNNAQVEDMAYLGIHRWDFVPLEQFGPAQSSYDRLNLGQSSTLIGQDLYGADAAVMKDNPNEVQQRKYTRVYNSQICRMRGQESHQVPVFGPLASQPRKLKQNNAQVDGVVFPAGSYVYNFTLLVDAKTPASINVPNGHVKFVLGAKVVRSGAFTLNVNGHMDVDVVRAPQESSEASGGGPQNDSVLISRVWEDRIVYSLNLERRNITLDVPIKLSLTLMSLSDPDVRVHQVQVYISETVTYIYSLDQAIRYVDPSLRLLLYQKDAPHGTKGSLISETEPTTINANITLVSEHNPTPKKSAREPYYRGRYGECRYLEPDVKGPYIRVRHRLLVVLRVSRPKEGENPNDYARRNHYEVKIDTPVTVLSRHCVSANISLPSYHAGDRGTSTSSDNDEYDEGDLPPSFDDAMAHELLGPSGAPAANPRGTKACFNSPPDTTA